VFNQARGTCTQLPEAGDKVDCGDVLYRVNDKPVLLLCGSTPAYRSLSRGESGPDVTELNANLVDLGYATRAQLDPSSDSFRDGVRAQEAAAEAGRGSDRVT
jgi:hypothetical protein